MLQNITTPIAGIGALQATELIPSGTNTLDIVKLALQLFITIFSVFQIRKQNKK